MLLIKVDFWGLLGLAVLFSVATICYLGIKYKAFRYNVFPKLFKLFIKSLISWCRH